MAETGINVVRRHKLAAPLAAALVAAGAVAAIAMATGSAPSHPGSPAPQPAAASAPQPSLAGLQHAFVTVVQAVSPSVVQIEDSTGLGSGVVLDEAGDIVTNQHVVAGATSFTVTAANGTRFKARLVGSFPPDDLAVIAVTSGQLEPARFADSSKLRVGDIAIAIGNPLGLRSSVTQGIVSGFREAVQEPGGVTLPSVIQTSAAINPGNSGGALVDLEGRVIGIPTLAALDPQLGGGSAPGIGFAIPSNLVTDIARQIVSEGHVVNSHRAYLGVRVGDTGGRGVVVMSVATGGPASSAGIGVGDLIVSVAGRSTPTVSVLTSVVAERKPGQRVDVVVERRGGARTTLHARLGALPSS